jgi:hypothetical protein
VKQQNQNDRKETETANDTETGAAPRSSQSDCRQTRHAPRFRWHFCEMKISARSGDHAGPVLERHGVISFTLKPRNGNFANQNPKGKK